jgi:hypothetical protein
MRSLRAFAIFGTFALAGSLSAQSLAEHAAAAAGATVGTAAGKPISNALTKIFGQADHATATAAGAKDKAKVPVKPTTISDQKAGATKVISGGSVPASGGALGDSGAAAPRSRSSSSSQAAARHHEAPVAAAVQFTAIPTPVVEPPRKEPTIEQLQSIQIGATHGDLQTVLGKPASQVIVPDDDGHLRESCQYWANGRQIGTVRLDNGQVVKVDIYN